jgi:hypothetical protein
MENDLASRRKRGHRERSEGSLRATVKIVGILRCAQDDNAIGTARRDVYFGG